MFVQEMIDAAASQFKQNFMLFCENENMDHLTPALAERFSSGLKTALAMAGSAAYQVFLQGYECTQDVVVVQGETFRFKAMREKSFLTPFGEMTLPRRCFQNKADDKSHVPLDVAWGMQGQYMACEVREAVLFSAALITPEETATLLRKCSLFQPHPTAIKHVVEKTGAAIEAQREGLEQAIRAQDTFPEATQAVAISIDGATLMLKEKGTALGRPAERPTKDDGKAPATAYRTAMVGSISYYGAPAQEGKTPERIASRYVAQMPEENWPTLKARLEAELAHMERQCPNQVPRLLLLDGARSLWNYVESEPAYAHYHKLIDFWHTTEHLSLAAEALFGKGSAQAQQWYEKYRAQLKESDYAGYKVQRSMDYYEKKNRLSQTSRGALQIQRTFFHRNAHRMEYKTFRQRGWPIGSGPVEAACKTLIKTRLCRSGMRWSRKGGQNILTLRTYIKSNRWDAAWEKIKRLEIAA